MYVPSPGFLSTAYQSPSIFFLKKSTAILLVQGIAGKKITAWSVYKDAEREVLVPPTMLKIDSYKEIEIDNSKKTVFLAKAEIMDTTKPLIKDTRVQCALEQQKMQKVLSQKCLVDLKESSYQKLTNWAWSWIA